MSASLSKKGEIVAKHPYPALTLAVASETEEFLVLYNFLHFDDKAGKVSVLCCLTQADG